ncbi:MAG: DUF1569 domain-containing protein [Chitinophagaceae bacterium]
MKSIFEAATREDLVLRIQSIKPGDTALWGKMTLYQMLRHCILWDEMVERKRKYKQVFIGKLFGKVIMKKVLKDDAPLRKNTPTLPVLKIVGSGEIEPEKVHGIKNIQNYAAFSNTEFVHPFFGKMTREQIGILVYKHTDHHLRQFGA